MKLEDFNFYLPKHLIAQTPAKPRDSSKLLCLLNNQNIEHKNFKDIINFLKCGDVLVLNDTKVIPALLFGYKFEDPDKKISINLVKQVDQNSSIWQILAKPGKKLSVGDVLYFDKDKALYCDVISNDKLNNEIYIRFSAPHDEVLKFLSIHGKMPLPPYIKRDSQLYNKHLSKLDSDDINTYQTEYARHIGSFAAPTAGLHFTQQILEKIKAIGVNIAFITLHVGLGTFLSIKTEKIEEHKMHSECFSISDETADVINNAKKQGGKLVCVGTTTLRALESSVDKCGAVVPSIMNSTDIFIKPGYDFKIVDSLITNFHLPKSTLFILVAAFTNIDFIHKAYTEAISFEYRFFSYGDACYIEKSNK